VRLESIGEAEVTSSRASELLLGVPVDELLATSEVEASNVTKKS